MDDSAWNQPWVKDPGKDKSMDVRHAATALGAVLIIALAVGAAPRNEATKSKTREALLSGAEQNSDQLVSQGRHIFRFDTFGDEAFWGGQLQLHQAINGLTPRNALNLGLKVDADALPPAVLESGTAR